MTKKINRKKIVYWRDKYFLYLILPLCLISLAIFSMAYPMLESGIVQNLSEDTLYSYNFTNNVTGTISGNLVFSIEAINSSMYNFPSVASYYWIKINSSTGIMNITSTKDNETGLYVISVHVLDSSNQGTTVAANFTVYATNDYPNFTPDPSYTKEVKLPIDNHSITLTATDEERQYPLVYNLNILNCSLAAWSTKPNCNLNYSFKQVDNVTNYLNLTNLTRDDIGNYNLTICVTDNVNNTQSLPQYRDANYDSNKTTCKNTTLILNQALIVDVSNCSNAILQENENFFCQINVTTRGQTNILNASSNAKFKKESATPTNPDWFFKANNSLATDYVQRYNISVTPGKKEIGNWSINFTVKDNSTGETLSKTIEVFVNRTQNANPSLVITPLPLDSTSVSKTTQINLTAYDNDLLIQDKLDGFDEQITFQTILLNRTTREVISNLNASFNQSTIPDTNMSQGIFSFFANVTQFGNYTLNVTITDKGINGINSTDSKEYNFTILSKTFPIWNQTVYIVNATVNTTFSTTQPIYINLSKYVSDSENSTLTFSNSGSLPSFSLNPNELINFTPYKLDVGYFEINITADNGYLTNTTLFIFNISNLNSPPIVASLQADNITTLPIGEILPDAITNTSESSLVTLFLKISDDDLVISPQYNNETISAWAQTINATGTNIQLINFSSWDCEGSCGANQSGFIASFTPIKSQVGTYNVSINVQDQNNISAQRNFTLNIAEINNPPILEAIPNQTSTVGSYFYLRPNVTDIEDGSSLSDGNLKLTFNYTFLYGTNFFNSTIFNSTTGEISTTFNNSQGGRYEINLTVIDSGNLTDSKIFWIYVYDTPIVLINTTESVAENSLINIPFNGNHSVANNLLYEVYVNGIKKMSLNYSGDGTYMNFPYSPDFTEESFFNLTNITIIATNLGNLSNQSEYDINVTHTNYPLQQIKNIPNITANNSYNLDLDEYFADYDAEDPNYNQTIGFVVNTIDGGSGISIAITNWTNGTIPNIVFSSSTASQGNFSITAYEYNITDNTQIINSSTSNNFSVTLSPQVIIIQTPAPTPSNGGGGGTQEPNVIKLLAATEATINNKGYIEFPFQVINTGKTVLKDISLSSIVQQEIPKGITVNLSQEKIASINPGEMINETLFINVNTEKEGKYNLILFANVSSPKISDWTEISLNIIKSQESEAKKMIVFTEQLIIKNPECLELNEVLQESKRLYNLGDYTRSLDTSQQIVESCRKIIEKNGQIKEKSLIQESYTNYLLYILLAFVAFLVYFIYQRARFKNKYAVEEQ